MLTEYERERYARQIALSELGQEGQEKLKRAKVFIAGAGGLGAPVSIYLAAAGFGEIKLADHDRVYAVVRGLGFAGGDAPGRPTQPVYELALERAYANAGITPESVDYIEAHGSGSPEEDRIEAQALATYFGAAAPARATAPLLRRDPTATANSHHWSGSDPRLHRPRCRPWDPSRSEARTHEAA